MAFCLSLFVNEAMAENYDPLNKENPSSFYNKVSPRFQEALDGIPDEYLVKDESELVEEIRPNQTVNCLRFRLWEEYNKAMDRKKSDVRIAAICRGICATNYFYKAVLRNKKVLAYLLVPPKDYEDAANEALMLGLTQVRRILHFPLWDKDGKPDSKVARLQLDVVKMLDNRLRGAPTQRIEQKTLQANVDISEIAQELTMKDIEAKLRKLRGEEEKNELLNERRPKLEEFKSQEIGLEVAKPLAEGKKREF